MTELLDANKLASFVVDDINGLWKLWGIHPRWGPQWECLSEVEDELRVKVTGKTGAIFKIRLPGLDYRFITIDENNSLKEINYIIFENFIYSIARRWHNILNNAGPFEHGLIDNESY